MARRTVAGWAGVAALAFACTTSPQEERERRAQEQFQAALPPARVVVVSISGLTPDLYRGDSPAMPNLAQLARAGVSADAMRSVAPAARYPAHATLVTGRLPADHGIVADHRLGDHGVRGAFYSHASHLGAPTLWERAGEAGLLVASLGWPTTVGAEIALNLPDAEPSRRDEDWVAALSPVATPRILELARARGAARAATRLPGATRDAVLAGVACDLLAEAKPPQLMLVHFSGALPQLAMRGAEDPDTRRAFGAVDAVLGSLLTCAQAAGVRDTTAWIAVGDHGVMPVHTLVSPNVVLAGAGLLTPDPDGAALHSWSAIARSNGGSAFVYARRDRDALLARRAFDEAARRTRAFRVVSAEEMLSHGADPKAWFGLEAEPGFRFDDAAEGPLERPAGARGAWGYLPAERRMDTGFVAWGAGLARSLRVPEMDQTDVAPTLAKLLGLSLDGTSGRTLVGVLRLPTVSAPRIAGEELLR